MSYLYTGTSLLAIFFQHVLSMFLSTPSAPDTLCETVALLDTNVLFNGHLHLYAFNLDGCTAWEERIPFIPGLLRRVAYAVGLRGSFPTEDMPHVMGHLSPKHFGQGLEAVKIPGIVAFAVGTFIHFPRPS